MNNKLYVDTYRIGNAINIDSETLRNFELDIFTLKIQLATKTLNSKFFPDNSIGKFFKKLYGRKIYLEKSFRFKKFLYNRSGDYFLKGYWQSEKYFKDVEGQIRIDFQFKKPLNEKSRIIEQKIKTTNSISIHVRRGDYVTNLANNSVHGVLSKEYYKKAIAEIERRVDEPVYYFFSDDPNWVMRNLTLFTKSYNVVEHNEGLDSWQDMYLMSCCRHHIIANSSFSWWGAWLNPSEIKQVIAPKNWFATNEMNIQTMDLLPQNWQKI